MLAVAAPSVEVGDEESLQRTSSSDDTLSASLFSVGDKRLLRGMLLSSELAQSLQVGPQCG